MPVIAVNTRLLLKGKLEGIGRFTFETLSRITPAHPDYQFVFLFDRPFDPDFIFSENVTPLIISPQARHPLLYIAWFEFSLPSVLKRLKPDLFLSTDGFLSLSAKIPSLPVIHDINFLHHPGNLPGIYAKYYNYFFPRFAQKASRIATVSEFSKNDIAENYKIDRNKIDVVYNGVGEGFRPYLLSEIEEVRKKWTNGLPYFLYVGSIQPRKNIANLIEAYNIFRKKTEAKVLMVLAGQKFLWTKEMGAALANCGFSEDIIFTGRVDENELTQLTASALAATYVPYFEGFGIPVIEAMKCGVPVITSSVTSLPEVAANAALLVNPQSIDEIAEAMTKIVHDAELQKQLAEKGLKRAAGFNWDDSAAKLWESMYRVMNPLTGNEYSNLC